MRKRSLITIKNKILNSRRKETTQTKKQFPIMTRMTILMMIKNKTKTQVWLSLSWTPQPSWSPCPPQRKPLFSAEAVSRTSRPTRTLMLRKRRGGWSRKTSFRVGAATRSLAHRALIRYKASKTLMFRITMCTTNLEVSGMSLKGWEGLSWRLRTLLNRTKRIHTSQRMTMTTMNTTARVKTRTKATLRAK